jgi:hypothetical protein
MTRQRAPESAPHQTGLGSSDRSQDTSDLDRRRSKREALRQVEQLRELLSMLDAGSVELDEFGFAVGLIGAKLGGAACSGRLAS